MKQFQIILGLILFASVTTFAQSPRIKLNQITKDTVKGSVLISSPTDSGMVYSRDFYIAYGADTVLILYGDTLAATSEIISSVLSDGVTITGNGTLGSELTVDTSTVISTIQGFLDTLTNRNYLTTNQTITLSGDVTGSGTTAITATVVDDSHNHIISNVDFLQDSLTAKANASELSNYVTIAGTETITGAKTFTAALTQSGGDANFDSGTLFVDESANRVGIGTSSPNYGMEIVRTSSAETAERILSLGVEDVSTDTAYIRLSNGTGTANQFFPVISGSTPTISFPNLAFISQVRVDTNYNNVAALSFRAQTFVSPYTVQNKPIVSFNNYENNLLIMLANGNVGIGTTSPSYPLEMGSGAHVTTGGVWTDASDIKLKENINYYYPYGLSEILNLKPTVFDYINGEKNSLGFIAQDVFEIIPEAISSTIDENGNETMGIKMVSITATLVNAIKEQQTEIDQLKTLITDLTNRLIILENK